MKPELASIITFLHIISIMKTVIASEEPKKFVYHDYKTFSHESFKNNLMSKTVDENFDSI